MIMAKSSTRATEQQNMNKKNPTRSLLKFSFISGTELAFEQADSLLRKKAGRSFIG